MIADPPVSIVAATWAVDSESILLVNNGTRTIDVYGRDGRRRDRISSPGSGELDFNVPLDLQRTDSGYVLNDENQHLLWLDERFHPLRSVDLRRGRSDDDEDQLWLDKQSDIQDKEAIGLLTKGSGRGSEYGFYRVRFAPGGADLQLLDPIPMPSGRDPHAGPTWRFQAYSAVDRYLVRVSDRVYWFRLSEDLQLELVEYKAGALRRLKATPAQYSRWPPALPQHVTFEEVPAIFRQLEGATMISQMFTDGRRLFLLGHTRQGTGIRWTAFALDTEGDKVEYSVDLPTSAAEVVVLPGERETAVLEIEAAKLLERRPRSMLLLDNGWLEKPAQAKTPEALCTGEAAH